MKTIDILFVYGRTQKRSESLSKLIDLLCKLQVVHVKELVYVTANNPMMGAT